MRSPTHWKQQTGETVTIQQSHGGSGKQARAVIDGLDADVVTLALAADIDAIAEQERQARQGLAGPPAQQQLALHVDHRVHRPRREPQGHQGLGRPRQAGRRRDHAEPEDLGRGALELSRRLRLGAGAFRRRREPRPRPISATLFRNVPVLDTGARGSTTTFAQRGLGDVFLAWENEAFLVLNEFGADKFEIVVPSESILAEPPVAVVDGNVDAKGTRKVAEAYLEYLYSPEGQAIAAKHYYRPSKPELAAAEDLARFPKVELFGIDRFGGWKEAQAVHFADGGVFDQIYKPTN